MNITPIREVASITRPDGTGVTACEHTLMLVEISDSNFGDRQEWIIRTDRRGIEVERFNVRYLAIITWK